ncbi:uncharacterized protein B0J16DRAFT_402670 [Fusarium flagelliforme]|uniref:Uncharacterized protein n=1 Tax=Fusarium flagelliforme TaxID=2675880 RepID=A0A395M8B5_9HYPO|nr:uncharacterized protein B0J16DRAFT_402670 [Fusarium flagelliforme]KAH7179262.1 hypothetical protein B0J16DRAFT_402670 [Fusarium flagelliforme]RFN44111.1 hypothetical protein FIE12Z_11659 [Fusarium flagelliforme]
MPLFSSRKKSHSDMQRQLDRQYNHGIIQGANYPGQINSGPINQVPMNQGQINQQNLNGQNNGQSNHGQNNNGHNTDKSREQGRDKPLPSEPLEAALSGFVKAITTSTPQQPVPMYAPQMRKSASFHYSGRPSFPSIWGDPFGGTSAQFNYHETPEYMFAMPPMAMPFMPGSPHLDHYSGVPRHRPFSPYERGLNEDYYDLSDDYPSYPTRYDGYSGIPPQRRERDFNRGYPTHRRFSGAHHGGPSRSTCYGGSAPPLIISSKPWPHSKHVPGYELLRTPRGFYPYSLDPKFNGLS